MRQGLQRLEFALLGVVALSLLLPQTAELERLTYRYLFELDGRTTVEGYSWGCVELGEPRVEFSALYQLLLRHRANRSPDDCLMARVGAYTRVAEPLPAEAWRGHPLATWVALHAADDQLFGGDIARLTSKAGALELLREAQRREPDNGLPWAVAAMLVRRDDPAQARAWLAEAARRPNWESHTREAIAYLQSLLEARGLPPFDAAHTYLFSLGGPNLGGALITAVIEQVQREVDAPDGRPTEMMDLLEALDQVRWAELRPGALARTLSRQPRLLTEFEHRLGPERARRLEQDLASANAVPSRPRSNRLDRAFDYFDQSNSRSMVHSFVAGLFLACLILGLPWRFEAGSPRAFRLALAGCGALGAWVLFGVFQAFNHEGGLGHERHFFEPLLSHTSYNLLLAAASAATMLAMQFGPGPARLRPLSLAALLALPYLLTGWSVSLWRAEYVAWVMSLAGG